MDFDETNNYIMLFYDEEPVFVIIDASIGDVKYYVRVEWNLYGYGDVSFFYCAYGCTAKFVYPYNSKVQLFGTWNYCAAGTSYMCDSSYRYRYYGMG